MTRRVHGTLTNANGTPLAGFVLAFVAVRSTPATVAAGSALEVTLGEAGEYDVALLDGRYRVSVRAGGPEEFRPRTELGLVTVTAGPDIDLLTLIGAPGIDQSDVQHLIDEALAYIAQAEDARDAAQLAETGAQGWSDRARDWATKIDGEVAPGAGYSAKHHAQAAASSALAASGSASAASGSALAASGSAGTAAAKADDSGDAADLARDWAELLGGEVVPGEGYSSRHHAEAAASSALAASGSASAASGSALAAAGSAGTATTKAQDATDAAALAQDWATKTGAAVAGGEYSAKHHAAAAASSALAASGSASAASGSAGTAATKAQDAANAADLAQDWAEGIGEVEPGAYSAKHHAQEAATVAASTALATIADALADRFERVTLYEDISALPGPRMTSVLVDETNDLKQSLYWIPAVGSPQLVASSPTALDDAGVLNAVLATLFASGQSGAWYDIAPSYVFQDTAGTTPALIGDPVGRLTDRSGRNNHALQATATARPILPAAGYRLRSDFSDDRITTTATINDGEMWVNTPWGHYKSQLRGVANFHLPLNDSTSIIAREGQLNSAQGDAVRRYFGTDRKCMIALSPDTTIENLRVFTGGAGTDVLFVGANGATVTKTLSANSASAYDVASDGLTAPVAVVFPESLVANTALQFFYCHTNQLTGSIPDLSANTALQFFYCHTNQLTGSIPDLSANTALQYFYCYANQLTGSIPDLSANTALQDFRCHTNQLTGSIPDLSANTALTHFYCHTSQLTGSIPDLSANTALKDFRCYTNQLTGSIPDLSANTALQYFYCYANQLTGSIPDLSANTALQVFRCHTNQLTDYAGGGVSATLGDFRANDNLLTAAAVNSILADFVAAGRTTGTRILNLGGTGNAAPTGQGLTDKATLISRGWTVTTN